MNVPFANIDETADFIVKEIIEKNKKGDRNENSIYMFYYGYNS